MSDSSVAERNVNQRVLEQPNFARATAAVDGADTTLVTITVYNGLGRAVGPTSFDVYLSDSAAAVGVTATTASGTVTDKTAGTTGQVLSALIAKKYLKVQNLANGTYQLGIVDSAKTAFKVCVKIDGGVGRVVKTLATADYGS